jgi:dethiobiotin synthetase
MPRVSAIFVTGTGTGVGKTFVASGLIRQLRGRGRTVEALKPVISGFDPRLAHESDSGRLLAALGRPLTAEHIAAVSPYRLRAPVAPDLAARLEGAAIDFRALTKFCRDAIARRKDGLIIEGVGGVMVPLDDRHTVLDWMIEIGLPLLVVAGSYVGTLSHTLTALDVLGRNGLKVASVVVSETPRSAAGLDETAATVRRFATGIEVFALPRLPEAQPDHQVMAALADLM